MSLQVKAKKFLGSSAALKDLPQKKFGHLTVKSVEVDGHEARLTTLSTEKLLAQRAITRSITLLYEHLIPFDRKASK